MRKAIFIAAMGLLMVCAVCYAGSVDKVLIPVTSGASAVNVTNSSVRGWIEEIQIDVVSATTTGDIDIAISPSLSTMTDDTIYSTNDIDGDVIFRPRLDGAGTDGAYLTSDPPWRKVVVGEDIIVTLENVSATNKVFNVIIKYEKQD